MYYKCSLYSVGEHIIADVPRSGLACRSRARGGREKKKKKKRRKGGKKTFAKADLP